MLGQRSLGPWFESHRDLWTFEANDLSSISGCRLQYPGAPVDEPALGRQDLTPPTPERFWARQSRSESRHFEEERDGGVSWVP